LSEVKVFPRRLSFTKICDILVGYLNAGADNQYIGVSEVAEKSNVTLHNISRNNNFLKSWHFVEENEHEPGKYRLSREAAEFAYAYRINPNGENTRHMLNKFLSKDQVLTTFIKRVQSENLNRDIILTELPRVIGDLRADKVGLTAFIDMITYAFNLDSLSMPVKAVKHLKETKKSIKSLVKTQISAPKFMSGSPTANISINLTISPEINPEMLKAYVKALLEAYDEHYKNK